MFSQMFEANGYEIVRKTWTLSVGQLVYIPFIVQVEMVLGRSI